MVKLTKAIIKKYGISKKAWAVARGKSKGKKVRKYSRRKVSKRKVSRRKVGGQKMVNKASSSFLGVGKDDIWKGVGSGLAGIGGGLINKVVPQLEGNIAQGVAGLLLANYTKGKAKQIGKGMVIKTIGDFTEDNAVPMILNKIGGQ